MAGNRAQGTAYVYYARAIGNTPAGTVREKTLTAAKKLATLSPKKVALVTLDQVPNGHVVERLDGSVFFKGSEPVAVSDTPAHVEVPAVPEPPKRKRRSVAKAKPVVVEPGGFDRPGDTVDAEQAPAVDDDEGEDEGADEDEF